MDCANFSTTLTKIQQDTLYPTTYFVSQLCYLYMCPYFHLLCDSFYPFFFCSHMAIMGVIVGIILDKCIDQCLILCFCLFDTQTN